MKKKLLSVLIGMLLMTIVLPVTGVIPDHEKHEYTFNDETLTSYQNSKYNWPSIAHVVSAASYDNVSYAPSIVADTSGTVHIAWVDDDSFSFPDGTYLGDIFYRYKLKGDSALSPVEYVTWDCGGHSMGYTCVFVDSTGIVHIVWVDRTECSNDDTTHDYDILYKWRNTNGVWSYASLVSTESTANSFCPSMVVDSHGTVHVAWQDMTGPDHIRYKSKAVDESWSDTTYTDFGPVFSPKLALDPDDTVHLVWSNSDDVIYTQKPLNGNWIANEDVSNLGNQALSPSIAVDTNGKAHIIWGQHGVSDSVFYRNRDSTGAWSGSQQVYSGSNEGPTTIALTSDGVIHVAWQTWTNIFYSYKDGSGWSPTEVIDTEGPGESMEPVLCAENSGTFPIVYIVWTDTMIYRESSLESGNDRDIFYKRTYNQDEATQYTITGPAWVIGYGYAGDIDQSSGEFCFEIRGFAYAELLTLRVEDFKTYEWTEGQIHGRILGLTLSIIDSQVMIFGIFRGGLLSIFKKTITGFLYEE